MNRTLVTGVVFAFRDRDYKRELLWVVGSMLKPEEVAVQSQTVQIVGV